MAVTVTDNRIVRNDADATTGWTGTTTLYTAGTDPDPIESTGALTAIVGLSIFDSYHTAAATNLSNSVIYAWVFSRLNLGNTTAANGGLMIYLGNATNAGAWKVAGADLAAFRHDSGPTGWQCPALDTTRLPASPLSRVGSAASVNFATIERVGTTVNSLIAAPGMNATYIVDIIRILDPTLNNGCALTITSGSSVNPGKFSEIVTEDRSTANLKAHGIIRELGTGTYGVQGPLMFGTGSGTASSWFEDKNATVIFEDRKFRTNLYKIFIADNGTGTTTFKLGDKVGTGTAARGQNGCFLIAPPGVGAEFDSATDTDVTDVFIYGSTFSGFTNGIRLNNGQEFIANIISDSGTLFPGTGSGAFLFNNTFNNLAVSSSVSSSVFWNTQSDVLGRLDGSSFTMGSSGSHAIEFGSKTPSTISFSNITFTSYQGTGGSNLVANTGPTGSAVYNNSGKLITINVSGGTLPSVRNGSGATTSIVSTVSISVTGLKDNTEVRVYETGTTTEVAGAETATDGTTDDRSFTFSATPSSVVDIVILSLAYENERINGYIVPSSNASIPIQQRIDRNYLNPAGP
jgi:hypothetical protein